MFKLALCIPDGCTLDMFASITEQLDIRDKMEEAANFCVTKDSGRDLTVGNIVAMYKLKDFDI